MPLPATPSTALKRLRRFQNVVNILVKYGFGEILYRIRVWEQVHFERAILKRESKYPKLTAPQRLRLALEELGPTFIKLGQILSTRPDLVPPEIIIELKKLQMSVHYIPTDIIRKIIESELGRPISDIFDSFEDEPLAAASLSQVHRAVFDGQQVVLKVQRPNIVGITEQDIAIMRSLAGLAERYSRSMYFFNPVGLVEEFAEQIRKELDFRMEANNMRLFAQNFAGDQTIHVPRVYRELCTKRLITMEYLDGICIADTQRLVSEKYNLQLIAKRGTLMGFKAALQFGFFHADPHPGNIIILPGNIIGLVDYGMMATLSLRDRERLAKLVLFISLRDEKRVARALNELMESEDVIPAEELEPAMSAIIKEYGDLPVAEVNLAAMLFAMMRAVMVKKGRFRPQLLWLAKSIATIEDMAHTLHADFNMVELGQSQVRKMIARKVDPLHQTQEIYNWLTDTVDLVKDVPYDIGIILRELRKGRIKIEFEHIGLEPFRQTINRVSNRISLTIIIAALLISSSLIVLAGVPPLVRGVSLLGFIGYIIAGILSVILVLAGWLRSG